MFWKKKISTLLKAVITKLGSAQGGITPFPPPKYATGYARSWLSSFDSPRRSAGHPGTRTAVDWKMWWWTDLTVNGIDSRRLVMAHLPDHTPRWLPAVLMGAAAALTDLRVEIRPQIIRLHVWTAQLRRTHIELINCTYETYNVNSCYSEQQQQMIVQKFLGVVGSTVENIQRVLHDIYFFLILRRRPLCVYANVIIA